MDGGSICPSSARPKIKPAFLSVQQREVTDPRVWIRFSVRERYSPLPRKPETRQWRHSIDQDISSTSVAALMASGFSCAGESDALSREKMSLSTVFYLNCVIKGVVRDLDVSEAAEHIEDFGKPVVRKQ